jgi:hypothetical protein
MVAAALARGDLSVDEVLDDRIDGPGDPEDYIDVVLAEQVDCCRAHPAGKDMGYLVFGKERRKFSRFMAGALEELGLCDRLVLDIVQGIFRAMPEML